MPSGSSGSQAEGAAFDEDEQAEGDQDKGQQDVAPAGEEHGEGEQAEDGGPSPLEVAAVTFANGGDNISVYVPVFANSPSSRWSFQACLAALKPSASGRSPR